MNQLSPEALDQVALYFQALSEPIRLRLLNLLREGPRSVGELAEACGSSVANVSRHLALLARHGLLERQAQGTSAYYAIADPAVYELCNVVCDTIARRLDRSVATRSALRRAGPAAVGAKAARRRAAG